MAQRERPLSPHWQIYKPQITSVLSILHRLTGVGLTFFLPFFVWFLMDLAFYSPERSLFTDLFFNLFGVLSLGFFFFCLSYHLCNGIRHLLWDMGWGFELDHVKKTGWTVIFCTFLLTGILLLGALHKGGFISWP